MNSQPVRKLLYPSVVVLITFLFAYFIFNGYLLHPNRYMFAFGGDALVIYYDMVFHVCHDNGSILTGMNYPYGEYIYLTDMQGALSSVLQSINGFLFDICDCIPGIVHALIIYLLPVASLLVFFILKYFNVRNITAAVFAVLIVFLSPQMLRFGGHFGLAYPFVIPMAILWILRKHRHTRFEKRDLFVFSLLVFFTFNNPYVGFSAAGMLICAAVVYAVLGLTKRPFLKNAWITGSVGLLSVLIPFLIFHLNDPVSDRIERQWGFFF